MGNFGTLDKESNGPLQVLMGHPSRSLEDSGTEGELNCGVLAQEVSEEENISIWPREHSCYIW